jgi:hypothetical protein
MIVRYPHIMLRACEGTELGNNIAIIGLVSIYVVLIQFSLGRYNFTIRIKQIVLPGENNWWTLPSLDNIPEGYINLFYFIYTRTSDDIIWLETLPALSFIRPLWYCIVQSIGMLLWYCYFPLIISMTCVH